MKNFIPDVDYTAMVESAKVGSVKPDRKIYQAAEQLAAVKPSEILLIDNERPNLTAGDHCGWHVLLFDDYQPAESIKRIREALEF